MAEPAPAFGATLTDTVVITFISGTYGVLPPPDSSVANNGEVYFICGKACWIWTIVKGALTNAFNGEQNDHLVCVAGNNGPYTASVQDTTITIVPLPVNSNPPPPISPKESVRGTIKVGSGLAKKGERQ